MLSRACAATRVAKARDILVGEVALAERSTKDAAETLLDKVLTDA